MSIQEFDSKLWSKILSINFSCIFHISSRFSPAITSSVKIFHDDSRTST